MAEDSTFYKYTRPASSPPPGSPHHLILGLVPEGARVLDVGSGPGFLAVQLRAKGCHVTCVEKNEEALAEAKSRCDQAHQLDIGIRGWSKQVEGPFDAIIMADVLEHVADAHGLLSEIRPLLTEGGSLLLSVPNVAHGAVRLPLLLGDWQYESQGLLDETHLRFFTLESLKSTLARSGYSITVVERVFRETHPGLIGTTSARLGIPGSRLSDILRETEGETFQLVVSAEKATQVADFAVTRAGTVASSLAMAGKIAQLEAQNKELQRQVAQLQREVARYRRLLLPAIYLLRLRRLRLARAKWLSQRTLTVAKEEGWQGVTFRIKRRMEAGSCRSRHVYARWIHDTENPEHAGKQYSFGRSPLVSVIVPVYNTDPSFLRDCVDSVRRQTYPNWQLCLHDDASTRAETKDVLAEIQELGDSRILVSCSNLNQGISAASNHALSQALGEYVALLDHDDLLAPYALAEVVRLLNEHPDAKYIYSDEDKLDEKGRRVDPYFKSDWSTHLALSQMYTCHLSVYSRSLLTNIGGFRVGFEGSQDYDLLLRALDCLEPTDIHHIPHILYHWRMSAGSTSSFAGAKPYTEISASMALKDYMDRRGIDGIVEGGYVPNSHRVRFSLLRNPLVSVIIPFRDKAELVRQCVDSVLLQTAYSNYELLLVNNGSIEKETLQLLESYANHDSVRILDCPGQFNYSAINNWAVDQAQGEYVVLLNNDTKVITQEWMTALLELCQMPNVGVVGSLLLYPDDSIQHAGVVVGLGGVAGHPFHRLRQGDPGYFSLPLLIRDCSAVTAACMMVRRELYRRLGGLDEVNLPIAFNDVDFCLRVRMAGFHVVYTPYARLYHYESASRGSDEDLAAADPAIRKRVLSERHYMLATWSDVIQRDPFYNPNLSRVHSAAYCPRGRHE